MKGMFFFSPAVTSQPQAPGSCIYFLYPQQTVNCLPFANCSGAKCNMTDSRGYASFIVHKCQDPVTIDLSVATEDSVFQRRFNQSETVSSDQGSHMRISISRNATHLYLEVCLVFLTPLNNVDLNIPSHKTKS